jgi:hypothetical protein
MAQQELTLFFLDHTINSAAVNPANYKNDGVVISLPAVAFNYGNNAFTYNELFQRRGNEIFLNIEGVLDKLKDKNILQMQLAVEVFRVQFKVKKTYWSIMSAEKLSVKFTYSDDLIDLAWNGNAKYIGKQIEIGPALNFTFYRELSVGMVREWGKWTVGTRIRLLAGRADITTKNEEALFYTDPEIYQTRFKTDYEINTSGMENFSHKELKLLSRLDNPGLGLDLGLNVQLSKKWKLSGSLIDWGYIKWNRNVNRYRSSGDFTFKGLELNEYFELDTLGFDDYADSVRSQFVSETIHKAYVGHLVPKMYLGAKYQLNANREVGIMGYAELFNGIQPAFSLYYGQKVLKYTQLGVSYAYKNRVFHHLGFSCTQQIRNLQLMVVSDDVVNLVRPKDSRNINFRFGINVHLFGKRKVNTNSTGINGGSP